MKLLKWFFKWLSNIGKPQNTPEDVPAAPVALPPSPSGESVTPVHADGVDTATLLARVPEISHTSASMASNDGLAGISGHRGRGRLTGGVRTRL